APEPRRQFETREAVHEAVLAELRAPEPAGTADMTRDVGFDRHAIAGLHLPQLGGARTDLFDNADRLMARDQRIVEDPGAREMAFIHFIVRAADAVRFDAQQRMIVTDPGHVETLHLEGAIADLDRRAGLHILNSSRAFFSKMRARSSALRKSIFSITGRR